MVLALGLNLYANRRANVKSNEPSIKWKKMDNKRITNRQCVETLQREPKLKGVFYDKGRYP